MVHWDAIVIFIVFFLLVTVLGFVAARWRQGDLNQINEWGLAGRRFGTVITWFLLGGDLYTACEVPCERLERYRPGLPSTRRSGNFG